MIFGRNDLWKEFEFGYSGCKPAKERTTAFSMEEKDSITTGGMYFG